MHAEPQGPEYKKRISGACRQNPLHHLTGYAGKKTTIIVFYSGVLYHGNGYWLDRQITVH
jgi:hypothetical protein